jgi:hypothetical protein
MKERKIKREDGAEDLFPDYADGQFLITKDPSRADRWAVYEKRQLKPGLWGMKDITRKEGFTSVDQAKEWIKGRPNLPKELLVEVEIDSVRTRVVRSRPAVEPAVGPVDRFGLQDPPE